MEGMPFLSHACRTAAHVLLVGNKILWTLPLSCIWHWFSFSGNISMKCVNDFILYSCDLSFPLDMFSYKVNYKIIFNLLKKVSECNRNDIGGCFWWNNLNIYYLLYTVLCVAQCCIALWSVRGRTRREAPVSLMDSGAPSF